MLAGSRAPAGPGPAGPSMQPRAGPRSARASSRACGVPLPLTSRRWARYAPVAASCGATLPRARAACGSAAVSAPAPAPGLGARAAPRLQRGRTLPARFSAVPVAAPVPEQAAEIALPLPTAVESAADDPLLHNPLQRMERMGTGWFGLVADYEGVVVDSTLEVHKEAWRQVAREMRLPMPLGSALDRIRGVRDDAIIMQLFTWSRNPSTVAAIAARKEELYDGLMNNNTPAEVPGVRSFLESLHNYNIPVALASPLPERRVRPALERLGLERTFAAVITAEDNGSGELENSYLAAAHALRRPPLRVAVVGDSNRSVEAARALGMKSVVVTGGQQAWNFSEADLVVRGLGQLSVVNLKKLFSQEGLVEAATPWEEIRASREAAEGGGAGGGGGGSRGSWSDSDSALPWPSAGAGSGGGGGGGSAAGGGGWVPVAPFSDADTDGDVDMDEADDADSGLPALAPRRRAGSGEYARVRSGGGGGGRTAGLVPAAAAAAAPGAAAGGEDEEDSFEVILPPKSAAVWDA